MGILQTGHIQRQRLSHLPVLRGERARYAGRASRFSSKSQHRLRAKSCLFPCKDRALVTASTSSSLPNLSPSAFQPQPESFSLSLLITTAVHCRRSLSRAAVALALEKAEPLQQTPRVEPFLLLVSIPWSLCYSQSLGFLIYQVSINIPPKTL